MFKTNSGRKRLNMLGAFVPAGQECVHLTGEATCDAVRVIEYVEVVENAYMSAPKIVLFVDNVTYFHANLVSEWLEATLVSSWNFSPRTPRM